MSILAKEEPDRKGALIKINLKKKSFPPNQGKWRKGRLYWMLNEEREQQAKTQGSP